MVYLIEDLVDFGYQSVVFFQSIAFMRNTFKKNAQKGKLSY